CMRMSSTASSIFRGDTVRRTERGRGARSCDDARDLEEAMRILTWLRRGLPRCCSIGACAVVLWAWASAAMAQAFPSRPLRIIVPLAAGGVIDLVARAIGTAVHESTGQPVIVENRPGASSIIGMNACAKAPPDSYTIC